MEELYFSLPNSDLSVAEQFWVDQLVAW